MNMGTDIRELDLFQEVNKAENEFIERNGFDPDTVILPYFICNSSIMLYEFGFIKDDQKIKIMGLEVIWNYDRDCKIFCIKQKP